MTLKPNPHWRGDPTFLPEALKAFGVKVQEWPGWRNRGHGDFGAIQGIICHHTATNTDIPGYIANHPELGLCSQIHLNRDGTAVLTGVGIAWHAGRGSYPGWPTNDANRVSIGIEAASDGYSQWPAAQMEAYYRICAAILWFLGKRATTATLLAHHEYSGKAQGKIDPSTGGKPWDMGPFRAEVNKRIDQHTKPATSSIGADMYAKITTFIKGYLGPLISDAKDIRQQLTGARDLVLDKQGRVDHAKSYPGWAQLGKNADGRNLTMVDALAAARHDIARVEKKLDQLLEKEQ